jgi:conjugative transfer region protein TrbK
VTPPRPGSNDRKRSRRIALALAFGSLAAFGAAWAVREPAPPPTADRKRQHGALQQVLLHCGHLGDAALSEPACRAAWAEHRRRFLQVRSDRELRP